MNSRLHEFGFKDIAQLPKILLGQAVTLGLPASDPNVNPVTVIIERGLIVPVQLSLAYSGSIIMDDGAMVHVSHQNPSDPASALQVTFIEDIPYDIRVEVYNVMRRAIQADATLVVVWSDILIKWKTRFPPLPNEIARQAAGHFLKVQEAFEGLRKLIGNFLDQADRDLKRFHEIPLKITIQTAEGFQEGWQGEEFVIDRTSVQAVLSQGLDAYMLGNVGPKLEAILKNPLFHSLSEFSLTYESNRVTPVIKLVVTAPPNTGKMEDYLRGIEFNPV